MTQGESQGLFSKIDFGRHLCYDADKNVKGERTVKVLDLYISKRQPEQVRVREACRGIVVRDRMVLLSYEGNTDQWFLPGGGLEEGESLEECCIRELAEETGYTAGRMTLLTSLLTTPAFCTEKIGIYLAQGLTEGDMHLDEDEFLGVVRMPLSEAIAMVMRGEIRDGKTICGLLMAKEVIARQKEQA